MYKSYAKIDEQARILQLCSSFHGGIDGGVEIGEDTTAYIMDKYAPNGLYEEHGIPQYKYIGGAVVERTAEEIAADIAAIPTPKPTAQDQIDANAAAIAELAEIIAGGAS